MITAQGQRVHLLPHHEEDLRSSGLTDETIEAAGIYSEEDRNKLAVMLNRKSYPQKHGAALVFPFRDEAGTVVLNRVKPTHPPKKNGKVKSKYMAPTGQAVRAYFPPDVFRLLDNPECDLLVTEGEKKALKATQEGFPTIGLTGCTCWHVAHSTRLLPDLERIKWKGRKVFIVFDSDSVTNPLVRADESQLAAALIERGAKVKIVRLPGDDGKVGLDDFLVAYGPGEFKKLLEEAEDPEPPDTEMRVPANQADPATEARIIRGKWRKDGHDRLRFWRGEFHLHTGGRYVPVADEEMRGEVTAHLADSYIKVGRSVVGNVIEHLRSQAIIPFAKEQPEWLDAFDCDWPAREMLATKSGLLHLPTIADGGDGIIPTTPAFFSTAGVDYRYDPEADCPQWKAFLQSLWDRDPECIDVLQEWMGYLLLPDASQQKLLMLIGPPRSGKGTIGRIIKGLLGKGTVASPTLASLSGPFGLWPLLGKSAALIADARLSGRADAVAVVEELLSISGEDPRDVHRKNLPTVTGVPLPVRFTIMTNELPNIRDASGAFMTRIILLRLGRSFTGREDKHLAKRLLEELPGILNWAIEGWRRLNARGYFQQPESGQELLEDLHAIASPVRSFVGDWCTVGPGYEIGKEQLFNAWKDWCRDNGRDHPGTMATFAKDLRSAVPDVRNKRGQVDGKRVQKYEGITLS